MPSKCDDSHCTVNQSSRPIDLSVTVFPQIVRRIDCKTGSSSHTQQINRIKDKKNLNILTLILLLFIVHVVRMGIIWKKKNCPMPTSGTTAFQFPLDSSGGRLQSLLAEGLKEVLAAVQLCCATQDAPGEAGASVQISTCGLLAHYVLVLPQEKKHRFSFTSQFSWILMPFLYFYIVLS